MNPNVDKADHVLNIDNTDNRPDVQTVLATAPFYGLTSAQARKVLDEVVGTVATWQDAARRIGIARADVQLTASAFSALPTGSFNPP